MDKLYYRRRPRGSTVPPKTELYFLVITDNPAEGVMVREKAHASNWEIYVIDQQPKAKEIFAFLRNNDCRGIDGVITVFTGGNIAGLTLAELAAQCEFPCAVLCRNAAERHLIKTAIKLQGTKTVSIERRDMAALETWMAQVPVRGRR